MKLALILDYSKSTNKTIYIVAEERKFMNKKLGSFETLADAALFCQAILDLKNDIDAVNKELQDEAN